MNKQRLSRLPDAMARHVQQGALPGLVTAVSHRGEVHVDVIGAQAVGGAPMRRDTIFRITSMTKPVAAVAAMILVEECRLRLDEPVDRLLPELANRQVLTQMDGLVEHTVPAERPITLRDLLTFRMGFGVIFGPEEEYPILRAARELELGTLGPPVPATPHAPDEWMRRLGSLPLMCQPGERWLYNSAFAVLGVLIARAADQPLETFLRERIFAPLGMKDTAFSVPAAKLDRLATSYWVNAQTGGLDLHDSAEESYWSRPPVFPDAAAGLVSTIDDYLAFGQMLLNQGKLGNERILSRASVETMTADHLTPGQKARSGFFPGYWENQGWGFGVSVVTGRDNLWAVPGRYGWDGGYGTSWYNDPREDLVAILMTQRGEFPLFSPVWQDFWSSVYQAIE
ncbi:MAG TPA: serine hydrolase domain-containing protein [Symbiobacteriaceae bacterium]|nr:serine hydrolase domain-containing protein [Symbiobacteriaceae bacterium]